MTAKETTVDEAMNAVDDTSRRFKRVGNVGGTIKDEEGLPPAFPGVAKWLPLLPQVFTSIHSHLEGITRGGSETSEQRQSFHQIKQSAEACDGLAKIIESMFSAIKKGTNAMEKAAQYAAVVEANGDQVVEKLMEDVLNQMMVVAKPPWVADEVVTELDIALGEITQLPPSLQKKQHGSNTQIQYGNGIMMLHNGKGTQASTVGGLQVNGPNENAQYHVGS
ncbi:uncharacterized protein CCOS01_12406 [Colletotrichum costaricense]|uniref:NACHT-NTPase and P-loop NTPases N-terminal domain-containing protein n=1 Tax=Colletotrichum costaricense TaxID=1209916 RepID=A0AAI9YMS1_9PEZI|nr:uncharacterized protein CCOS01_12406 [Colletotrichum costaricense]KAK1516857.1 hypothetical protein CCOS01_12406 [Colletotrichum costaricense]